MTLNNSSVKRWRRYFPLTSVEDVVDLTIRMLLGKAPDHRSDSKSRHSSPGGSTALPEPNLAFVSIILGFFENKLTSHPSSTLPVQSPDNKIGEMDGDGKEVEVPSTFCELTFDEAEHLYMEFVQLVLKLAPSSKKTSTGSKQSSTKDTDGGQEAKGDTRKLIKSVSDLIWSRLTNYHAKETTHIQSLYAFLSEYELDSFGLAYAVVAACQLLGYPQVLLALSEDHAWVEFPGDGVTMETAEVTWQGRGQEDKRGLPVTSGVEERSWLYLNGHPVVCRTRVLAAAAAVTAINPVSLGVQCPLVAQLKRSLLWHLYDAGVLSSYPLALATLSELEEVWGGASPRPTPMDLLKEGLHVARRDYQGQHVYPYLCTAAYLYRSGDYPTAIKYWAKAANVIANYNYSSEDEEIYKEFLEVAYNQIPRIMRLASESSCSDDAIRHIVKDAQCLSSILRFYDGICLWEEGSSTPVLHVGWADKLMLTLLKFEPEAREGLLLGGEECEELGSVSSCDSDEGKWSVKKERLLSDQRYRLPSVGSSISPVVLDDDLHAYGHSPALPPSFDLSTLAKDLGQRLLNPEFLLGLTVDPFLPPGTEAPPITSILHRITAARSQTTQLDLPSTPALEPDSPKVAPHEPITQSAPLDSTVKVVLRSAKMRGIKELLTARKLNSSAIKLQLTAQSQVRLKRTDLTSAYLLPRKRVRRT